MRDFGVKEFKRNIKFVGDVENFSLEDKILVGEVFEKYGMNRCFLDEYPVWLIDKEKMYLFRSGNFYIFLGEDADNINNYVVLKKTPFCKETKKCGFPIGSFDDYMKVFHN